MIPSKQSSPLGWTCRVQDHAEPVDGDVMMEPAQECEIVGMVVPARRSLVDVVGLEAVATAAAIDGADTVVSHPDVTAGAGWDCFGQVGRTDRTTVIALEDHSDRAGAENLREDIGPGS